MQYSKCQVKCSACKEWNTVEEKVIQKAEKVNWSITNLDYNTPNLFSCFNFLVEINLPMLYKHLYPNMGFSY